MEGWRGGEDRSVKEAKGARLVGEGDGRGEAGEESVWRGRLRRVGEGGGSSDQGSDRGLVSLKLGGRVGKIGNRLGSERMQQLRWRGGGGEPWKVIEIK